MINQYDPSVIAIDAPILKGDSLVRKADRLMKKYGAMPLTMPSMRLLAQRGTSIAKQLEAQGYEVIEVFPTGTAKILGFYEKKYRKSLQRLHMQNVFNNKHEYDAYLCSLTAKLHYHGETKEVGDEQGKIVVPINHL